VDFGLKYKHQNTNPKFQGNKQAFLQPGKKLNTFHPSGGGQAQMSAEKIAEKALF